MNGSSFETWSCNEDPEEGFALAALLELEVDRMIVFPALPAALASAPPALDTALLNIDPSDEPLEGFREDARPKKAESSSSWLAIGNETIE